MKKTGAGDGHVLGPVEDLKDKKEKKEKKTKKKDD